jgi:alpha,alpha-trehalase
LGHFSTQNCKRALAALIFGAFVAFLDADCSQAVVAAVPKPPSETYAPLYVVVQSRHVFADSKTFADAVPRASTQTILRAWRRAHPATDEGIRNFIARWFDMPTPASSPANSSARPPLTEHIAQVWPLLTHDSAKGQGTALSLSKPFVVPGGRFREMYYWDSYFTMLGLHLSHRQDLVDAMVSDFGELIDRYGHVPNGTRTYYLSRSQPPVFYLMAGLSSDRSEVGRRRRLHEMRTEHRFWMQGEDALKPGQSNRRLVRLPAGAFLNRYWDDRAQPRDESWREDVALAKTVQRPASDLYRDIRAAAESGWDFSSRWLGDANSLGTIRTTHILPVDLNSLLYGLERAIAQECQALGETACAAEYHDRAEKRQAAIEQYLWNDQGGFYSDYDLDRHAPSAQRTAAMAFPLFVGLASKSHADATAAAIAPLVADGGLLSTEQVTGQQWDAPNGWAPLQWVAIAGLRAYGHSAEAMRIETGWLTTVMHEYCASGRMLEKYDVKGHSPGGGGEYPLQDGFGWTNGVSLAALDDLKRHNAAFDDTCH